MSAQGVGWLRAMVIAVACLSVAVVWTQEAAVSRVELVRPVAGERVTGVVKVQVRVAPAVEGRLPWAVYAGLGGPPYVALGRVGESLDWEGELDSRLVPNGECVLIVRVWVPRERIAPITAKLTVENGLQVYFADLHSHCGCSDGVLFPAEAHTHARQVSKLDVFALTDHLEQLDEAEWNDMRQQAFRAHEEGAFVVFTGLEWTKPVGHVCIFDPPTYRWPLDLAGMYKAAAEAGVIVKFNHPGDGTKDFDGLAYSEIGDQVVEMIEVRGDAEEKAYIRALNLGWHLGPDGSSDVHTAKWGDGGSWTGILAPGLSRRAIWDALKRRHFFSTGDRNCRLFFWVNEAVMGEIVPEPVQRVHVTVDVRDPDAADVIAKIELFEDGQVVQVDEPKACARRWEMDVAAKPGKHYYFVKMTQADGNRMWSAPVWVTVAGEESGN